MWTANKVVVADCVGIGFADEKANGRAGQMTTDLLRFRIGCCDVVQKFRPFADELFFCKKKKC